MSYYTYRTNDSATVEGDEEGKANPPGMTIVSPPTMVSSTSTVS